MYNNKGDIMIICVDLDSTLLTSDKKITSVTKDVLNKCKSLGHRIIINTARSFQRTLKYFKEIEADYMICNAGADIYNKGLKRIYEDFIDEESTYSIVKDAMTFSEVVSVQTENDWYTTNILDENLLLKKTNNLQDFYLKSYKILLYKGDEYKSISLSNKYKLNYSRYENGFWARISPLECSKLNGLKIVLKELGMTLNEVISFGDDVGDWDFVEASFIGVIMSNGLEILKDKARYVCDSNDNDGIAKFLINYFMID